MKDFAVPTREQVSADNQKLFDNLTQALGFVPNLYATFAHSDNGLAKYLAFENAKTSLTNKEKEAVNLVVSEVNGCLYCQSAHTVVGKLNGFSEEEILNLRSGQSSDSKLAALVALAEDITENRGHASAKNLDAFFKAGYDNGSLVDLILQIGDKVISNYLHNLTEIPIDFPRAPKLKTSFRY